MEFILNLDQWLRQMLIKDISYLETRALVLFGEGEPFVQFW